MRVDQRVDRLCDFSLIVDGVTVGDRRSTRHLEIGGIRTLWLDPPDADRALHRKHNGATRYDRRRWRGRR